MALQSYSQPYSYIAVVHTEKHFSVQHCRAGNRALDLGTYYPDIFFSCLVCQLLEKSHLCSIKLVGMLQALCVVFVCINAGFIASGWACPSDQVFDF